MIVPDRIHMYRQVFAGREDIVARHWRGSRRSGYAPLCRNEWRRPPCRKGEIPSPCAGCPGADYMPLSASLLRDHFRGRHILGVYPLFPDGTCRFLAVDFDNHTGDRTPEDDVRAFHEVCRVLEFPVYLLRSKSGTGYHAWLFFEEPVPAWKARLVGFSLLQEAGIAGEETHRTSFDRLFPNQDRLTGRSFGNLIALPFQGKAARFGHTLFLDPETGFDRPCRDQWRVLATVQRLREGDLDELIGEWDLSPGPPAPSARRVLRPEPEVNPVVMSGLFRPADFDRIADRCAFIAHCRDDARTLSEPEWYILLTISARCRNGKALSHRLSAAYPRYSFRETEAKIRQALTRTGPYRCGTIARINGTYCPGCGQQGRITSPVVLGHRRECRYTIPADPGWELYSAPEKWQNRFETDEDMYPRKEIRYQ